MQKKKQKKQNKTKQNKTKNKTGYTATLVACGWAGAAKKQSVTDRQTDRRKDGKTDRQTDRAGCRVARHATKMHGGVNS